MTTFEAEWRSRFERFGKKHEADHLVSGWSRRGLTCRLSLFRDLLLDRGVRSPAKALDLGSGPGTYVRFLAGLGHRA